MSHDQDTQQPSALCELHRPQLGESDAVQRVIVELRDRRREGGPIAFGAALLTFAIDALIFLCVTHLAACGVLPGIIAGGLIGSLIGARIFAARTRALGLGGSAAGALVLGLLSVFFSVRAFR